MTNAERRSEDSKKYGAHTGWKLDLPRTGTFVGDGGKAVGRLMAVKLGLQWPRWWFWPGIFLVTVTLMLAMGWLSMAVEWLSKPIG